VISEIIGVPAPTRTASAGGCAASIGALLARLELAIAFRTLLDRCQDLVLDGEPGDLVRTPALFTRRLPALPVRFTPPLRG
jgi:cytochrome P450